MIGSTRAILSFITESITRCHALIAKHDADPYELDNDLARTVRIPKTITDYNAIMNEDQINVLTLF